MAAEARAHGIEIVEANLNDYVPAQPVQATTMFRALYYVRDRASFFRQVAGYTERKLVFDVNPRQYALADVRADLAAAGFAHVVTRPFFVPQTRALPGPAHALLALLERTPLAALLLRRRFTVIVAASAG